LGAAYVTAYVFEGSPPGLGLEVGLLRWLFAAFLAALGVVGVQVVRFFVLDVVFLRAQGHRAPALVHVVVAMALYFVLGLFIAGGVFHQTLTGAIATSAVASVVLGLALQETLGNFFAGIALQVEDRKSTRLNSSHVKISYAVFCLKKKKKQSKEKED